MPWPVRLEREGERELGRIEIEKKKKIGLCGREERKGSTEREGFMAGDDIMRS